MSQASTERGFASLIHDFAPPPGHFDELLDEQRAMRPVWAALASHLGDLTGAQLSRAQTRVDRQIHENGVTYNVYAADAGPSRPWTLDVLPFIIAAGEWDTLARGLRQRARLLNLVAADLYGPRHLLTERLLPAALLHAHPGFLRPCQGAWPVDGTFLHLLAFDLSREPDGRWFVIETRAQAPSGVGYALENRATIARLFPQLFRALNVQPLQAFIHGLRQAIVERAPAAPGETPHVALLTPGPYNETYFEHAFLAKQLGFPLVEGADLTVRHDRLFLKTVSGLRPVHALLRRLDDDYCDPLELRSDSTLGVPGLVQAWRAGHVLIANAFGTGVLESRALAERLPRVCERLLGEPLETASPAADEGLALSHVPVWDGDRLVSRALMLRVFLAADGRGDYHLMPGGLARIAGDDRDGVSAQRGGGSKDTWVVSPSPVDAAAGPDLRSPHERVFADDAAVVSSRVAEHLFWLGRYAERSENAARMLRSVLERLTDADALPTRLGPLVLQACRANGLLPAEAGTGRERSTTIERALIDAMLDARHHQSLAFNVAQTVRVADAARDRLSSDNWRLLNRLHQQVSVRGEIGVDEALEIIDQAIVALVAVGGLEMAHMTRDHGWRFLSIGRHLERLSFVAATLSDVATSGLRGEPALLEWLLDLSDSLVSYRARFTHRPEWSRVLDLLWLDAHNPRSGAFQLGKLAKHVAQLPGGDLELSAVVGETERLLASHAQRAAAQRELFDEAPWVQASVGTAVDLATRTSEALTLRFFSHVYDLARPTI